MRQKIVIKHDEESFIHFLKDLLSLHPGGEWVRTTVHESIHVKLDKGANRERVLGAIYDWIVQRTIRVGR